MVHSVPSIRAILPVILAGLLVEQATAQTEWQRAPLLSHRTYPACGFDAARGRLVLFGGQSASERLGDTWEWNGNDWSLRHPAHSPSARSEAAAAFDPVRTVLVLFGGRAAIGEVDDTWEWDGTDWHPRSPTLAPTPRRLHAMTWDGGRQRVLLFGGRDASFTERDDTWEWDGASWTQRQPTNRPGARSGTAMCWDALRDRVVLFGGSCFQFGPCWRMDTWEWDGNDWTEVTPGWPAPSPAPRWSHGVVFDPARSRTVLFGGSDDPGHYKDDTWEWDGVSWTQRQLALRPVARLGHGMAFDPTSQRALVLGGEMWGGRSSDLWTLDAIGWSVAHAGMLPNTGPFPRADMTWDGGRDVVVWFGDGFTPTQDRQTWEWDGERWDLVLTGQGPLVPERHALAWLPSRNRIVLHEPSQGGNAARTWEYDGASWSQLPTTTVPGVERGYALALDPRLDHLVLFGGLQASSPRDETWLFDGIDWTQAAPSATPTARSGHAMTLDAPRQRVVLFGGNDGLARLADTWEWDGTTWSARTPLAGPSARDEHRLAYDSGRRRTILHGGTTSAGYSDETWEWDGSNWFLRAPTTHPPASYWQVLTHDATRGRTLHMTALACGTWRYGPTDPGSFATFGSGCAGSLGTPALFAELGQRPCVGVDFHLQLTDLPGTLAFVAAGFSNTSWFGIHPLPLDLAPYGYPGCTLQVQTDVVSTVPVTGGRARWTLPLPNAAGLIGLRWYAQALAFDANGPGGLVMSPGGAGTIGSL